ncbi:MAG: hypothetical protein J0I32_15490 [Sphingobacteriales bacterium]|jgi:hypothetical protein|nr:hypothetical protein [Sphingobacteriales bacterium]OJW01710.1 MAG: hypothetical protein BGO52_14640 [Sphingobacteriales bacterium 44-61]
MKFRTLVFLFIIAIVLIGALTKPGPDAFKEFYTKEHTRENPPVIEYTNGVAYSIFSVTSFTAVTTTGNNKMAVPVIKEKYLGLFGRFWKL